MATRWSVTGCCDAPGTSVLRDCYVGKQCNLTLTHAVRSGCYSPHSRSRPFALDRTQTRSEATHLIGTWYRLAPKPPRAGGPVYRDRAEAQARGRIPSRGPQRPPVHHAHGRPARGPRPNSAAPRGSTPAHRLTPHEFRRRFCSPFSACFGVPVGSLTTRGPSGTCSDTVSWCSAAVGIPRGRSSPPTISSPSPPSARQTTREQACG